MGQVFLPDPRAQYNVLRVLLAAVQVRMGGLSDLRCPEKDRPAIRLMPVLAAGVDGMLCRDALCRCRLSMPSYNPPAARAAGAQPGGAQARPV